MFSENQQIGIYKLVRKLGRGGFGEVWLAEKTSGGFRTFTKRVAVKLPHTEQVDFKAIEQEAMLWEQVSGHANVLPIIDADVFDGQVVIVSEYAEGGSLAEKLEKDGKFSVRKAVETTIGILKGLEFLHNKQIIHRDIKPQNILLQNDTPRLADFGISRAMNTKTFSSNIVGTDAYMSPEALDGKRNVQTDVWSVGVVLYELLKDDLPFPQEHPSERMFAILMKEFEPLSMDIPYRLRDVVKKALAKKPEERYVSATAMREDLTAILAEMSHLSHAETKPFQKEDLVETKRIIESGEQVINTGGQNNPVETVQPIRLRELDDYGRTEAAATQSSLSTEPIKTISSPISNLPPTQVVSFANAGKSKWQNNLRFVLYGGVPLVLFSMLAIGFVTFSNNPSISDNLSNSNSTVSNTGVSINSDTNNVLIAKNIRIGDNLEGWISTGNKMKVDFEIKGIGSPEVIEEVRKDLSVEINGQTAIIDTEVINGVLLEVRATIDLPAKIVEDFNSDKEQDFLMRVELFYRGDVVAKTINTKFQKGKGNTTPSLGSSIAFGNVEEQNVQPKTTTKPVASIPTPTPAARNNVRQRTQTQTTPQRNNERIQTNPSPRKGSTEFPNIPKIMNEKN